MAITYILLRAFCFLDRRAKPRTTATDKTRLNKINSPLLKLPGEIRNRIYEFVAADDGGPVRVQHLQSDDKDVKVRGYGTYAGLTRVCRQIREEFLPIHQKNARVTVDLLELDIFISTFFDTKQDLPLRVCPKTRFHYFLPDSGSASASLGSSSVASHHINISGNDPIKEIAVRIHLFNHTEITDIDFQPLVRAKARFFNQVTWHAWIQSSSLPTGFDILDLGEPLSGFWDDVPLGLQAHFLRYGLWRTLNMERMHLRPATASRPYGGSWYPLASW